jgi:hypothetical protein
MLEGAAWVDEHSYEYDGAGEGASQGKPPKAPTGKTLHGLILQVLVGRCCQHSVPVAGSFILLSPKGLVMKCN